MDKVYFLKDSSVSIPFSESLFRGEMVFVCFIDKDGLFLNRDLNFSSLVKSAKNFWMLDSFQENRVKSLIESSWKKRSQQNKKNQYYRLSLIYEKDSFTLFFQTKENEYQPEVKKLQSIHLSHWSEWSKSSKISFYADRKFHKMKINRPFNDYLRIDSDERILESSSSNIFFIKDDVFYSPNEVNLYFGIGAQMIKQNFEVNFVDIQKESLEQFEASFLINQVRGIEWVDQIDEFCHFSTYQKSKKNKIEKKFEELFK